MSDVVIRAEGLGKKYVIRHQASGRERYIALRDVVGRQVKGLVRSARDMLKGRQLVAGDEVEEFWALKDVSFEIKRGEVVGIIGRNGAGKSTLLKMLSRVTEPSTGRVKIRGRVASLLEVGTGFHPELTGRENIYLNGAILGMSRADIKRKFDEIVAFAEVEKFLDTPVKRYSSGMYVRLAFAVAAHLEPEILVVDEVLAVGDAEFQKKCLGKMQGVAGGGRTVLFVSHNMAAIAELCSGGMLLESGRLKVLDSVASVLSQYSASLINHRGRIAEITVGARCLTLSDGKYILEAIVNTCQRTLLSDFCPIIRDNRGNRISIFDTRTKLQFPLALPPGDNLIRIVFDADILVAGSYTVDLYLSNGEISGDLMDIASIIVPTDTRLQLQYQCAYQGVVRLPFEVTIGSARDSDTFRSAGTALIDRAL